jgi:FixJ family two-component response regulator
MSDGAVVHVVEDDESFRKAIARLLRQLGFDARVYASADEFLLAERSERPECLLLDVGLPRLSGVELQTALADADDPIPIVFLTGSIDVPMAVHAMKEGAVNVLSKPVKRDLLVAAINEAIERGATLNEALQRAGMVRARFDRLTARERVVFERVVHGKLNKQIAFDIGTSVRTVKAHRSQVMRKMEVASIAELVSAATHLRGARLD